MAAKAPNVRLDILSVSNGELLKAGFEERAKGMHIAIQKKKIVRKK